MKVAVALAIGCLAYGLDRWLSDDGASVLTAVVVGATIAYCWFTYDLVAAAEVERQDRARAEAQTSGSSGGSGLSPAVSFIQVLA